MIFQVIRTGCTGTPAQRIAVIQFLLTKTVLLLERGA